MSDCEVIDIDKPEPTFDPSIWIGTGKIYPDATRLPRYIAAAYKSIYDIPDQYRALLYNRCRAVRSFVVASLPPQSPTLSFAKPDLWFSFDPPHTDVATLLDRPIPHPRVLAALHTISGQKWFDGHQSICDCRYNNGEDRFPLYVLQLWQQFSCQASIQQRWQASLSWTTEQQWQADLPSDSEAAFRDSQQLLSMLPWQEDVRMGGCTTADFTELLGSSWISGDVLDLGLNALRQELHSSREDSFATRFEVSNLSLLYELQRAVSTFDFSEKHVPSLYRLGKRIRMGLVDEVFVLVNVRGVHWVMVRANLKTGVIEYGMHAGAIYFEDVLTLTCLY